MSDEIEDAVIVVLRSSNRAVEWPADELAAFQGGWKDRENRYNRVYRLRAQKIIQLVADHLGDLPRPRVDKDLDSSLFGQGGEGE